MMRTEIAPDPWPRLAQLRKARIPTVLRRPRAWACRGANAHFYTAERPDWRRGRSKHQGREETPRRRGSGHHPQWSPLNITLSEGVEAREYPAMGGGDAGDMVWSDPGRIDGGQWCARRCPMRSAVV